MTLANFTKTAGAGVALALVVLTGMLISSTRGRGQGGSDDESRIQQGFAIAPVTLNLTGKNRDLVGFGSYLVNAVGDCDGCHTSGGPPNFNYVPGGNPYFVQKAGVDQTFYLSGAA